MKNKDYYKKKPRFENISCSQCGQQFVEGDYGFSHCESHKGKSPKQISTFLPFNFELKATK